MKTIIWNESNLRAEREVFSIKLRKQGERLNKANLASMIAKERQHKAEEAYYKTSEHIAGLNGLISSCKAGKIEIVM